MKKSLLTVSIFLIALSNILAQKYIGSEEDINQILKNIKAFSGFVMDSDYEGIARAYTTDGKIMPAGPKIIEGYKAIKERWTLPEGVSISYHKILPEEIKIIGDHAYDYGYYEGTTKRADDSEVNWKGKYVIVWRRENEVWKIYLDIWNTVN